MRTKTIRRLLAATALVPLASACADTDDGVILKVKDQELVLAGSRLWHMSEVKELKVCFVGDIDAGPNEDDMRLVQEAVEGAWETIPGTAIDIVGWKACSETTGTTHFPIMLDPNRTIGSSYVGREMLQAPPLHSGNMKLPLASTLHNHEETPPGKGEEKAKFIAIHEFGHALGLVHEQEHPDYEKCVREDGKEYTHLEDGATFKDNGGDHVFLAGVDDEAVMNYCADLRRIDDLTLTDQEQMFAQMFYPGPPEELWLGLACESGCFTGGGGGDGTQIFLREDGVAQDEFTGRGAVFQREIVNGNGQVEIVDDWWFATEGPNAMKWTATRNDDSGEWFEDVGLWHQFSGGSLVPGQYYVHYSAEVSIDGVTPEPSGERKVWGGDFVSISDAKWTAVAMTAL